MNKFGIIGLADLNTLLVSLRANKRQTVSVRQVAALLREEPTSWLDNNISAIIQEVEEVKNSLKEKLLTFLRLQKTVHHNLDKASLAEMDENAIEDERFRDSTRKQILRNRIEDSKCRNLFSDLMRDETFKPEELDKGSNIMAAMIKYLRLRILKAENEEQFSVADGSARILEQLQNFELQGKSIDDLLIEILEDLNFRKDRANRFALEKRMLKSLRVDFENFHQYQLMKIQSLTHYIDIVRNGVGNTQNRSKTRKLAAMKRIELTPDALCKHVHSKQSRERKILNKYKQVRGTLTCFSFMALKKRDIIRELDLGPTFAISEKKFNKRQEIARKQKQGIYVEGEVEDDDDGGEGRFIEPLNFGAIQRALVYEFYSRDGNLRVSAVYKKSFIIDRFEFTVSQLFRQKKLRTVQFTVPGSITVFNLDAFCILVEDIVMQSMLL
eukprot:g7368.t1